MEEKSSETMKVLKEENERLVKMLKHMEKEREEFLCRYSLKEKKMDEREEVFISSRKDKEKEKQLKAREKILFSEGVVGRSEVKDKDDFEEYRNESKVLHVVVTPNEDGKAKPAAIKEEDEANQPVVVVGKKPLSVKGRDNCSCTLI